MTVSTTSNRITYTGDGVTVAFSFPYAFLKTSDLAVYQNGTLKTLTTHYSVSGTVDSTGAYMSGGTVTFVTAPAVSDAIVVLRDPDSLQSTKYPTNDSFPAITHERAIDKLTMLVQRIRDLLGRSFTLSDSDTSGASLTVPTPVANYLIGWNSSANGLTNYSGTSGTLISAAMTPVVQASTLGNGRTALGLGAMATKASVATGDIDVAAVTYAKIQNVSASRLLGNFTGGTAAPSEVLPDPTTLIGSSSVLYAPRVPVRQTVLSGPVDSSGLASFGGATGSTTVTASGTLLATAAAGANAFTPQDYIGSVTNPSWTGLSTNGTMYLYLDIANGAAITGSTTLAPVYQWGGTYSTTNNQNTFNIQEMTMKVGNGSTATQVQRVFVGEVTVAGGVVTAITWYALMGRYDSGFTSTLPTAGTKVTKSHNLGVPGGNGLFICENTSAELGYAVGDQVATVAQYNGSYGQGTGMAVNRLTSFVVGGSSGWVAVNTAGSHSLLTGASWKYKFLVTRGW